MSPRPEPIEAPARPVTVERVEGRTWRPIAIVATLVFVVGIALLKPWGSGQPKTATDPAQRVAAASPPATDSPGPTVDPTIAAASSRMLCNAPAGWRLITSEVDVLGNARTMYGTLPQTASGPDDPSIATAELRADRMFAVGVCRPNPRGLRVADLPFDRVTIWAVPPAGMPVVVVGTRILDDSLFRLGEAYYGAPDSRTGREMGDNVTASWQPGRYVVEIADATGDANALWLALNFTQPVLCIDKVC